MTSDGALAAEKSKAQVGGGCNVLADETGPSSNIRVLRRDKKSL